MPWRDMKKAWRWILVALFAGSVAILITPSLFAGNQAINSRFQLVGGPKKYMREAP